MSSHTKCAVTGCVPTDERRKFFRFPNPKSHLDTHVEWIKVIGQPKLKHTSVNYIYDNLRVCDRHFKADDHFGRGLKTGVIPTLNLPGTINVDVNIDISDEAQQTACNITPPSPLLRTPENLQTQLNISPLRIYLEAKAKIDEAMAIDLYEPQPGPSTQKQVESLVEVSHPGPSYETLHLQVVPAQKQRPAADPIPQKRVIKITEKQQRNPKRSGLSFLGVTRVKNLTYKEQILHEELKVLGKKARRLEATNATNRKRLATVRQLIKTTAFEKLTSKFTSFQLRFFENQIRNAARKKQARKYSFQDKAEAVAFWKTSPKMYKLLSNLFTLPSVSTLRNLLNGVILEPGISKSIFNLLNNKFSKCYKQDRVCTLIFDEMQLTPHLDYLQHKDKIVGFKDYGWHKTDEIANHVIVFMLRGIHKNWKQPVAYGYTKAAMGAMEIVHFYKEIAKISKYAGLKLIASVCDQSTTNIKAINMLLEETQRVAIRNGQIVNNGIIKIDEEDIIPIFDVPHLLKSMRNNLITKNLLFVKDGKQFTAKWEHILNTYLIDKEYNIRVMRKITDIHVIPQKIKKMKVSVCSQVFSESAAAAVKYCATFNAKSKDGTITVPSEALETAELFLFLDKVFDSLNCSKSSSTPGKPFKGPVSEKSFHGKFWIEALKVFDSMKFISTKPQDRSKPPVLYGWLRTLKGFLLIKQKLSKLGFKTFSTRNFNQDPIENFFCLVRQYSVRNTNPTCYQFQTYYKSLLIQNFAKTQSKVSNCEDDYGLLAVDLKQLLQTQTETDIIDKWHPPELVLEESSLIEDAAVAYISGYLVKHLVPIIKDCAVCKLNILLIEPPEPYHKFITLKEREGCELYYVNNSVFVNMKNIYCILRRIVPSVLHVNCLLQRLESYISCHVTFNFTYCEHTNSIKNIMFKKFILLYIYTYLKKLNNIPLGKMYIRDPNKLEQDMIKYCKFYKNKYNVA